MPSTYLQAPMTSFFLWVPCFFCFYEILNWKQNLNNALALRLELFMALEEALVLAPFLAPLPAKEQALLRETLWIYLQATYPHATWHVPKWHSQEQSFHVRFTKNGKVQAACSKGGQKRWGTACGQSLLGTLLSFSLFAFMALWFLKKYHFLNCQTEALWQAWS